MNSLGMNKAYLRWLPGLICLALAVCGIASYGGLISTQVLALLGGVGIVLLLVMGDIRLLFNLPALFLLGYVIFSMLTALWAMSGKFFLNQYPKIFAAAFFFLLVALRKPCDRHFARHVMGVVAGVAAICAFLSVGSAALPALGKLVRMLGGTSASFGGRLSGIFSNANIEAAIYGMGVLLSIGLCCDAEDKGRRALWAITLSFNALALLLTLSLGAIACFTVATVIYLIFAGKGRTSALTRMLGGAVPALVCGVLASRFLLTDGRKTLGFLMMLAAAALSAVWELLLAERMSKVMGENEKRTFGVLAGTVAVIAIYVAVGLSVMSPTYTFGTGTGTTVALTPGEHTFHVDADGAVTVTVNSYSQANIVAGGTAYLTGYGVKLEDRDEFSVVVPEDSVQCSVSFSAQAGTTIQSATIDGGEPLKLGYPLLPTALAGRLGSASSSSGSLLMRQMLARDGFKLFRLSPLAGHGVGAFESGISRVEDVAFETRYVHNHYVQILVEDGAIGFALFALALVSMACALWKRRRQALEGEYRWIYPALCAQYMMSTLQMAWDVAMSYVMFICCMYAVYGLITAIFAEPIRLKRVKNVETSEQSEQESQQALKGDNIFLARLAAVILVAMFMASIVGNLYAARLVSKEFGSYAEAYRTMEKAVDLDLYERNDVMLTYVMMVMNDDPGSRPLYQANLYADQLSKVQSNRIPYYLAGYYFNTQQYDRSIEEAKYSAIYTAGTPRIWEDMIALLKEGFIDSGIASPLLQTDDGAALTAQLAEYCDMFDVHNEQAVLKITLSQSAQSFMETVRELVACGGNQEAMYAILAEDA